MTNLIKSKYFTNTDYVYSNRTIIAAWVGRRYLTLKEFPQSLKDEARDLEMIENKKKEVSGE